MFKWNLWNVAMWRCIICWKENWEILLQQREWSDVFKWEKYVDSSPCDECVKYMNEGINLLCDNCGSFHCVKIEVFKEDWNVKAWEKYRVKKCPKCNDGQFLFNE